MDPIPPFAGFPPAAAAFFRRLKSNNNRAWFEAHKAEYLESVLHPARAFVAAMGEKLPRLASPIVADPLQNGSIFRIYRDTRFSGDKRPYKDHLGILFWLGTCGKLAGPGFYFELDESGFALYTGWYRFTKEELAVFRELVVREDRGAKLDKIVRKLEGQGWELGGVGYKRVPRGFGEWAEHPRGRYLRHTGFWVARACGKAKELHSAKLAEFCMGRWRQTVGLFEWLREMKGEMGEE